MTVRTLRQWRSSRIARVAATLFALFVAGATYARQQLPPTAVTSGNGSKALVVLTFDAIKTGVSSLVISGAQSIDSTFNSIDSTAQHASSTLAGAGRGIIAPEIEPSSALGALTLLIGRLRSAAGAPWPQQSKSRLAESRLQGRIGASARQ
jgi:hypothetical protein